MSRPSARPTWATDANYPAGGNPWSGLTNKTPPSAGESAVGFIPDTEFPIDYTNYLFNLIDGWIGFFDESLGVDLFGDGSDGDVDIDGVNTYSFIVGGALQHDTYFNDLTIRAGQTLKTNGYRFYVRGTCTIEATGVIKNAGNNATADAHGTGGAANALGGGGNGGDGVTTGANGGAAPNRNFASGIGGAGGNDSGGRTGGAGGTSATTARGYRSAWNLLFGFVPHNSSGTPVLREIGGGTGGGGGASAGGGDGVSGGGGGGGGVLCAGIRKLVNNGLITVPGGNGANASGTTGGGGGGGGGAGGFAGLVVGETSGSGATTAPGGTGGTKVGVSATNGAVGNNGTVVIIDISAGGTSTSSTHEATGVAIFTAADEVSVTFPNGWGYATATGVNGYELDVPAPVVLDGSGWVGVSVIAKTTTGFTLKASQTFTGEVRWKTKGT